MVLHIHLMDINGSPRLVERQPEPVSDPTAVITWITLFAMLQDKPLSVELNIKFRTKSGHQATAILAGGKHVLHIDCDNDVSLFMYVRDIIEEPTDCTEDTPVM